MSENIYAYLHFNICCICGMPLTNTYIKYLKFKFREISIICRFYCTIQIICYFNGRQLNKNYRQKAYLVKSSLEYSYLNVVLLYYLFPNFSLNI